MDRISNGRKPLTTSVSNITFGLGAGATGSKSNASSVHLDQLPKGYFKKKEDHQRYQHQEKRQQQRDDASYLKQGSGDDDVDKQALSDSIVERFTSHQNYDRNTTTIARKDEINRNRVVEEIDRVKSRRQVNEEERAKLLHQAMTMDAPKLARKIMEERRDYVEESKRGSSFLSCYSGDQDDNANDDDYVHSNPSVSDASFYKAIAEVDHLRQRLFDRASIGTNSRIVSANASADSCNTSIRADKSKSQVNLQSSRRGSNVPTSSSSLSSTANVAELLNDLIGTDSTSEYEVEVKPKRVGSAKLRDARHHLERAHDDNIYMSRFNSPSKINVNRNSNSPSNRSSTPKLKYSPYDIDNIINDEDRRKRDESLVRSKANKRDKGSRENNSNSTLLRTSFEELHHHGGHYNQRRTSYQKEGRDINDATDIVNTSSISLHGVLADALALPSEQYKSGRGMDTTSKDLKVLLGVLEDQINSQKDHTINDSISNNDNEDVHHFGRVGEISPDGPSSKASSPRISMMSPLIGEKYKLKREDTSSQLLSLATAIEAGDVAGKLLAAMMEKKSSTTKHRQMIDSAYATGAEAKEERNLSSAASTLRK